MLLGENINRKSVRYSDGFDRRYIEDMEYCASLISLDCFEEAWILLNAQDKESIPLLYNKMLCMKCHAGNEELLMILDRLWILLAPMNGGLKALPSPVCKAIGQSQKRVQTHLRPITFRYVDMFPHLLKDSVLRHMIACYLESGNTAKVIELGTPLLNKGYQDVIDALGKTKSIEPNYT